MSTAPSAADTAKKAAARRACELVEPGMRLGLGSGSTSALMVRCLGTRVAQEGLRVTGVPTSSATAELARSLGIALTTLDETPHLDLTLDGADEIDPDFVLIKGGGGALLHEKIVAAASERMVVMADESKRVARLGAFPLPVEVIPFGSGATGRAVRSVLDALGYDGCPIALRQENGAPVRTDEGNLLLDCHLGAIADAAALDAVLKGVPGVVETGLFLDLADTLVLGHGDGQAELHLRDA